ncbi:MAG: hypothetical protein JW828_11120 [Sedimentisphaerales bacterium]|nr:hypothetical protein [Sedimentisphaerales bacterium]
MKFSKLTLALLLVLASTGSTYAIDYYLRAEAVNKVMPDGSMIPMWGYALDPDAVQETGQVIVPGPTLVVPPNDPNLTIHLKNRLDVATSVIIPALPQAMTPQRFPAGDPDYPNRIRSLTHETPPGNAAPVPYSWTNVRPGSFMYHSGTHIAVQVQMGLYGPATRNAVDGAYSADSDFDNEVLLFYSEIDPIAHARIASGNYGPGEIMTSTIEYKPEFFLVNGNPYSLGDTPIPAGQVGQTTLLRLFNAGIETHVAQLQNLRGLLLADDGWPDNYPTDQYTFVLPAGKTKDVLLNPATEGIVPVYDRRLRLTNANASPGGLISLLEIAAAPPAVGENNNEVQTAPRNVPELATLAQYWLQNCQGCPADVNEDNIVNFIDFALMNNLNESPPEE